MKTIIAHPRFDYMADELVARNSNKIRKWNVNFFRFPDGTPNLEFPEVKDDIEYQDVTYIGDFSQADELFEHYNTLFNLVKNTAIKVRIIMPFFPMGTSERVEKKWKTETAHAFAHLISSLPSGRDSKNSIHIFDIHALVEQSLFNIDRMNAELHTTTSLLDIGDDEMIVFPDDGAAKRFREYFPSVPEDRRITCGKERIGDERIITIKEWNPRGKRMVIVDDLWQTGNTVRKTARLLLDNWAIQVRSFVPHTISPYPRDLEDLDDLYEVVTTNTIPGNIIRAESIPKLRVLSVSPLVERIILRN